LKETPSIGLIIILFGLISFLVLPYNTVLPVFAKVIFQGNAITFGYITSAVGVGALIGTAFLASRKPDAQLRKILLISTVILGVGLTGFGAIAQFTVSNIITQSESAPHMRGRVIGILLMAIFGMAPLGSLVVGAVSERIGAPATVLSEGIITLVIAMVFARRLLSYRNPE
jgi:hypothetical protein